MFTGIIETVGKITNIVREKSNIHFTVQSAISTELKIDQSVSHNGVCLTVTKTIANTHEVTAIQETLDKTNLQFWQIGTLVNLERCMPANGRFDGHIVQGHIDQTGICTEAIETNGSWRYSFEYDTSSGVPNITVEKGSICINGVSLTVVNSKANGFSVAIIPYTFENTNFRTLQKGDTVNLEFDILGKYIQKILSR
jgi:riboflavin synthase